jgi:type VI secretion system protein ImpL
VYLFMTTGADKAAPPVRFAEFAPEAAGVVVAPADVSGAFTAPGWQFMQDAFRDSDRFYEVEPWVVGDATALQAQDRDSIITSLRARYRSDYVQKWRAFVRAIAIVRPRAGREATADAAQKLGAISGPQSPLLAALSLVARNTAVDSAMGVAFQPVHAVVPPDASDKFVNDANGAYVGALAALQGALEQVTYLPPPPQPARRPWRRPGGTLAGYRWPARRRQLAQVPVDSGAGWALARRAAGVADRCGPIGAQGVATDRRCSAWSRLPPPPRPRCPGASGGRWCRANRGVASILNERGRAICAAMTPMSASSPSAPTRCRNTIAEVSGVLAPGTGPGRSSGDDRRLLGRGNQWAVRPRPVLSAPFVASAAGGGVGGAVRRVAGPRGVPRARRASPTPSVTMALASAGAFPRWRLASSCGRRRRAARPGCWRSSARTRSR